MIRPKFLIILADLLLAFGSLVAVYTAHFRFHDGPGLDALYSEGVVRLGSYLLTLVFSSYLLGLYDRRRFAKLGSMLQLIVFASLQSFFFLSALFYLLPVNPIARGMLFVSIVLFAVFQLVFRFLIRKCSRATAFANRLLIIGTGELAQKIADVIPPDQNPHSCVGFISGCRNNSEATVVAADKVIGEIADFSQLLNDYHPSRIIVALSDRRGMLPLKDIMHCKLRGVEVFDAPTYYEQQTGKLLVENIQPSAFIYAQGFRMTQFMRGYKRILDLIFSSLGLLLAAPVFPLVALIIKLDSPGPVFYKQLRVGEQEHEYYVYKFRSMSQDAEKGSGAVWAQKEDPRVTKVGKFIRKTRIDEIPQLLNVLKGDMSFVGPRPERMAFVERLKETIPYYSTRHFIKPGVTGWAQVRYPYGASDEDALEKLRYDLYYIKNYSVFLDIRIVLDTVKVVLSGFGGR